MFRNTKSFLWISAALILAGCGETDAVQVPGASDASPAVEQFTQLTWTSDSDASSSIELKIVRPGTDETEAAKEITVGESLAETKLALPRPTRAFGSVKRPNGLGQDFDTWGWETDGESAGVISYEGKTALVLLIYDAVDKGFVDELRQELVQYNGTPSSSDITSETATYEFWESNGTRLMLCYTKAGEQTWIASVALGQHELMDYLRMSPQLALVDARESEALWKTRVGETDSSKTTSQ